MRDSYLLPTVHGPLDVLNGLAYGSALALVDRVEDACSHALMSRPTCRLGEVDFGTDILHLGWSLKVDK